MTEHQRHIRLAPGADHARDTVRRTIRAVPAYRAFLLDRGLDPDAIATARFDSLPVMTKANYLHAYSRRDLLWAGDPTSAIIWSASSGSTGAPTFWPQHETSFEDNAELYDRIFDAHFDSRNRSTLLVVGFAMGNWIGGTLTLRVAEELRRRGHRISVVAPGITEAVQSNLAELGPAYDQVVLAGYPPFVQDVLDRAAPEVLRQRLSLLLAGEAVSERWRDRMLERIGAPGEPDRICSIYGTADAGVMGHETPSSIRVRQAAAANRKLALDLFGPHSTLPTLVEYDPELRFVEVEQGYLLFTIDGGMPLIRYRINDQGIILTADRIAGTLRRHGYCLPITTTTPDAAFLVLHRRSDISTSFYAVKLYPESIAAALEEPSINPAVTGKFVLTTETDADFAQTLDLRVELREKVSATTAFVDLLTGRVVEALRATNSEFRQLHAAIGAAAVPRVTAEPFGSARFRFETKHSYLGGGK